MSSSSRRSVRIRKRATAFTLMELLLVVAIMVAVLMIGWPVLQRSLSTQRLKKGGERIQAEWTKARNLALRTGRVHVFRHAVNSSHFVTTAQPSVDDEWAAEQALESTQGPASESPPSRLPEGLFFLGADVRLDQRSSFEMSNLPPLTVAPEYQPGTTDAELSGPLEWGTPIFFFPDGTSSSAMLVMADDEQRSISVTLRGLTGASRVGPIEVSGTNSLGDLP